MHAGCYCTMPRDLQSYCIPTVIIATPTGLRYASPEAIILALARPPEGLTMEEYKQHLENVRNIAAQMKVQCNLEEHQLAMRMNRNEYCFQSIKRIREDIHKDHTAMMVLQDALKHKRIPRATIEVKKMQSSIKRRFRFCLDFLRDVYDDIGSINDTRIKANCKKQAVHDVSVWVDAEITALANSYAKTNEK